MPKRATSCVFFPRYKEGEDQGAGHLTHHISLTYAALEGLFHLPLKDAAREVGLCPTTFKKACRRFDMQKWPFRKGQARHPIARRDVQTDGIAAAIKTLHQEPVCARAVPMLQTTEEHQEKSAVTGVTVSCTPPAWHDGAVAWSSTVRASSELRQDCSNPFGAGFSSAAPESLASLLLQASMALDTRCSGSAGCGGAGFQHSLFDPLDAPSYIDSLTRGLISIGVPRGEDEAGSAAPPEAAVRLPGSAACPPPPEAGPPLGRERPCVEQSCVERPCVERPCVEAVMEYLDGPNVGAFDFMFAEQEGAPPPEGASSSSLLLSSLEWSDTQVYEP